LEDSLIVAMMLNPDGRLCIQRLSEGLIDTGERLTVADGERIVRLDRVFAKSRKQQYQSSYSNSDNGHLAGVRHNSVFENESV
jgi:hypothetical protein